MVYSRYYVTEKYCKWKVLMAVLLSLDCSIFPTCAACCFAKCYCCQEWTVETVCVVLWHYNDVIMCALASQITSRTIVYSSVYSGVNQRKHQSSASLAFVPWPVNSPHKWPVTRKMFPFDSVIMIHSALRPQRTTKRVCVSITHVRVHGTVPERVSRMPLSHPRRLGLLK